MSTTQAEGEYPSLSVVVPLFNEEENVAPLVDAIRGALGEHTDWELLLVDDGSEDATAARGRAAATFDPRVRILELAGNYGQTAAMQAGFDHARGTVIVSMDGDLQNDPADIPRLVAKLADGYDVVNGYREDRQDHFWSRKVPSWVANRIIRWVTGVSVRDNGCSLRAYRREVLSRIRLYSEMHRFIPAVAAAEAGARMTEIPVRHHPRLFGKSKYGLSRIFRVLIDLLVIKTIVSFRDRPLFLFGIGAVIAAVVGVAMVAASAVAWMSDWLWSGYVLPAIAFLSFGLSLYLLMLGLLGEGVVQSAHKRNARPPLMTKERYHGILSLSPPAE